jgi:hypothetical protein
MLQVCFMNFFQKIKETAASILIDFNNVMKLLSYMMLLFIYY